MSKREITESYTELKPDQIFEAGKSVLKELGFEIFKTRPFAFLIQAKKPVESGVINANLIANAFSKEFTITVKGENEPQENVDSIANDILDSTRNQLRK